MRQAIGSTWILQLVIVFMLIFVAFLTLSINYTRAFKIKNEIMSMVEKYEGMKEGTDGSVALINNYLKYYNYSSTHACEEGEYGAPNLDSPTLEKADGRTKYYYCVSRISTKTTTFPDRSKYGLKIFFKFNLPVLGDLFTFTVRGTTIDINNPADRLEYKYT